jgi:hypothetical protein
MTLRFALLSAAAALALPAAMASSQQPAPTAPPPPLGGALNAGTQADVPPPPIVPPVETSVPGAVPAPAQPVETVPDVAEQAADAVEADAVAQTRVQAAAQGEAPPPAAAPVQAQVQPSPQPAVAPGPVALATAADLRAGVQVRDQSGALVGTVESADAASAVVSTGTARARLALASFGRNGQGLVIAMTRAQFEAAALAANPG